MEDGAVRAGEVSGALREGVGGALRLCLCVCWFVVVVGVGGGGGFPGRLGAGFCVLSVRFSGVICVLWLGATRRRRRE